VQAGALPAERGEVLADLAAKVELATDIDLPRAERERACARLRSLAAGRVLDYLRPRDHAVYTPAASAIATRLVIGALRAQHRLIAAHAAEVRRVAEPAEFTAAAHTVLAVLTACRETERVVLLPAMASLTELNLPSIAVEFDALLQGEAIACAELPKGAES
jgi:hypothetical protein